MLLQYSLCCTITPLCRHLDLRTIKDILSLYIEYSFQFNFQQTVVVVSVTLPYFLRPSLSPAQWLLFLSSSSLLAPSSLLESELYSAASHEIVVGQGVRVLDEQTLRVTKTSRVSTGLGLNLKVKKVYSNLRRVT